MIRDQSLVKVKIVSDWLQREGLDFTGEESRKFAEIDLVALEDCIECKKAILISRTEDEAWLNKLLYFYSRIDNHDLKIMPTGFFKAFYPDREKESSILKPSNSFSIELKKKKMEFIDSIREDTRKLLFPIKKLTGTFAVAYVQFSSSGICIEYFDPQGDSYPKIQLKSLAITIACINGFSPSSDVLVTNRSPSEPRETDSFAETLFYIRNMTLPPIVGTSNRSNLELRSILCADYLLSLDSLQAKDQPKPLSKIKPNEINLAQKSEFQIQEMEYGLVPFQEESYQDVKSILQHFVEGREWSNFPKKKMTNILKRNKNIFTSLMTTICPNPGPAGYDNWVLLCQCFEPKNKTSQQKERKVLGCLRNLLLIDEEVVSMIDKMLPIESSPTLKGGNLRVLLRILFDHKFKDAQDFIYFEEIWWIAKCGVESSVFLEPELKGKILKELEKFVSTQEETKIPIKTEVPLDKASKDLKNVLKLLDMKVFSKEEPLLSPPIARLLLSEEIPIITSKVLSKKFWNLVLCALNHNSQKDLEKLINKILYCEPNSTLPYTFKENRASIGKFFESVNNKAKKIEGFELKKDFETTLKELKKEFN